ncbi:MAG: FAD binding domain-containing protein [Chloroflexi bacterium]|nr:FAD binding domain-containing protein [Chloroflexota bacterium]
MSTEPAAPLEPPVETPRTLAEAYALLAGAASDAPLRPLAGATDLLVQLTGRTAPPPARYLDLWRLAELRGIAVDRSARDALGRSDLVLGALTTYAEIRRSPLCREFAPALVEAAATVGAAQIQNRGTFGGNLANASPAGDTLPVALAMDAVVEVGGPRGERTIPAAGFWPDYRRSGLAADEIILRVRLPIVPGRETRFRKVGTRRAQAISKVALALSWTDSPDATGVGPRVWRDVRVALASVAPTPMRAPATERILEGSRPTPETADRASVALATEIEPIDDVRSSAAYRRAVAGRVLHRLIREAGGW